MSQNDREKLQAVVADFLSKLSSVFNPEYCDFPLTEFLNTQGEKWRQYAGTQGVYYLYSDDGTVHYVGQGIAKYGVGYRVMLNAAKHNLIDRPAMRVGLILFEEPDLPWALALEHFLIRDLRPSCNTRAKAPINPK